MIDLTNTVYAIDKPIEKDDTASTENEIKDVFLRATFYNSLKKSEDAITSILYFLKVKERISLHDFLHYSNKKGFVSISL